MKRVFAVFVLIAMSSSCGVNPERAQDLKIRENDSETKEELTNSADENPAVAEAMESLKRLSAAIDNLDFATIEKSRSAILMQVHPKTVPPKYVSISGHLKTPGILQTLNKEDARLSKKLGSKGAPLLDATRQYDVDIQALRTFGEGLAICQTIGNAKTQSDVDTLFQNMNRAFESAMRIDDKVQRYSGSDAEGKWVDNAFNYAVCRYQVEVKGLEIADLAPVFSEVSEESGCKTFDLNVEAKQERKGVFGAYLLKSKSAFAETAPPSEKIDCASIPATSNAPAEVISLVKSNVQWLEANDILSMKTKFTNKEDEGVIVKSGIVSVLRGKVTVPLDACGVKDPLVVCPESGNQVTRAYEIASHYMERANFHRGSGRKDLCKTMANKAVEFASKKLEYDGKLIYQTSEKKRLQPSEIKAKIEAIKTEASTLLTSDSCQLKNNNN